MIAIPAAHKATPAPAAARQRKDFVDDDLLCGLLSRPAPDRFELRDIIGKSRALQPLTAQETAALLRCEDREQQAQIFECARELKASVYGQRVVLFAPLYVSNRCVNDCTYCAFRRSNESMKRVTLSREQLAEQVAALQRVGHKRLILVFGESPRQQARFIAESVRAVYEVSTGSGAIRRVNINAAPLDVEGFRLVKEAGIGTYQIFMETYHHETFARVHPVGTPKSDYQWRLEGLSRAIEAGCDDVGIGALLGLYDWRFEVLGLVCHALHLQAQHGIGPHTISFPRLRPACGVQLETRQRVSDAAFKRVIAILRLAVPYAGLILTAREPAALRRELMGFGVSQIDAGSRIELGGYTRGEAEQRLNEEQFELGDTRSLDDVVCELLRDGYLPSFCTACYRRGRTGEHFMELAIPGFIERFCTPNALMTLQEYLADYASSQTRPLGEQRLAEAVEALPDGTVKRRLSERLERIVTTQQRDELF